MNLSPSDEESVQNFGFSRTQNAFDKSLFVRIAIWGLFGFALFLFLHFREIYVESFELGSFARKYVVAQVDFVFPDEESTIILKQEASREIGTIYRIEEEDVYREVTEFQKYITQNPEGIEIWNSLSKENNFKNLAMALSLTSTALLDSRFTDVRTITRIEKLPRNDLSISLNQFFVFLPSNQSMVGKLPPAYWNTLKERALTAEGANPKLVNVILSYFEEYAWRFKVDEETAFLLRKLIYAEIPEKLTYVKAGERIIDQGEKVTARHLAMLKAMRERLEEKSSQLNPLSLLGSAILTAIFLTVFYFYLKEDQKDIFSSNRKLGLIASIIVLNIVLAKLTELFLIQSHNQLLDIVRFPLLVPFSAIMLSCLLNLRVAAFGAFFLTVIFVIALAVENLSFLVVNVIAASVIVLSIGQIKKRKDVFIVGGKAWLASFVVVLAFNLFDNTLFSSSFFTDTISTFIFIGITCILVVGLLPVFEGSFKILTDITLMELMDPTNALLRRLTIEAPGTYQHSVIVGSLAETAATAIGANGLFCRVVTQYHDIGKLTNAEYFTENQMGRIDMHQLLTPLESAKAIIAHVTEGVKLARKAGLPKPFIDIIKEHHGTTLVYYFYHKQLEMMGGDKSLVNEKDFRYAGPKPRSKESTIIMIADTLEAASRSLDVFNEETVTELVDVLVAQKNDDNQFSDSILTFQEMDVVKKTLVHALLATSHPRIKYPPHHPGEEG